LTVMRRRNKVNSGLPRRKIGRGGSPYLTHRFRAERPPTSGGLRPGGVDLPDLSDDGGNWEPAPFWVELVAAALGLVILGLCGLGVWALVR